MEPEEYEKMFVLEDTHWWFLGKRVLAKSYLSLYCNSDKRQRVLDVGCGTGGMQRFLRDYGDVSGVDLNLDALRYAKKKCSGKANLCLSTALSLPFKDESFSLVTAFDLLYHRGILDDVKALREFYRVCRKGGYLLITDSAFDFLRSPHDRATHARHRYTKREMAEKVSRAGFSVMRMLYTNFFLFPVVAAVRFFKRYTDKRDTGSDLHRVNPFLNRVLLAVLRIESLLLRWIVFPCGSSLICVAQRV
ncbi:MAG: methyltransferase domain-containing protein [Nitrospirota bacterium]